MITTIAIDDEPLALDLIVDYIRKTPDLKLEGKFENPVDAARFIGDNPVDLVFTDVNMPGLTGIEFAKSLINRPVIIFTTAFEKYAVQGYKLDVADYLLKPFTYGEFLVSVSKAERALKAIRIPVEEAPDNEFLFLKSGYKVVRIEFNDIIYIEGLKEYVKVFAENSPKPILSICSLKALEAKLPVGKFMRVHRSFIVNLHKINTIERSRIVFGKTYIPIGDQYKEKFQEFLDKNFL